MRARSLVLLSMTAGIVAGVGLSAVAKPPARAAVVSDEGARVVRIVIDGVDIARFDAHGLQVAGDLSYSGTITDNGAPQGGTSP